MKYYKINDKLVKANSLKSAIDLVKDSAASDIVKAITGMGRGFKLVHQAIRNGRGQFVFTSNEVTNENERRVESQLNYILQNRLGFSNYASGLMYRKKEKEKLISVDYDLYTTGKPAKLVVNVSEHYGYYKDSNKVKDSAASDVIGAINGLGQGWKLTKQTSQKEKDGRRSYLEFKHDKFVNGNIPKMAKELERAFQKLGYKENVYGDFVNQRNGNVLTPDYYDGMASILIIEKGSTKDAAIKTEYSYKGYKIIYTYGSFTIYSGYDEIASGFYSVNEAKEYINNYVIKGHK